jgi:hypothetical protein
MPIPSYSNVPRYVIGTLVLSTMIAAALTAFGSAGFGINLVYSLCIGLLTYAVIDLPRRWLWPQGASALVPMIAIALFAAPVGYFGGSFIASLLLGEPFKPVNVGLNAMLGFLALTAGTGVGATFFFWTRGRLAYSERDAAEARLKLLQAQIEPHFLFNTLANLQALIDSDPKRAQAMLGHLDGYLRATLASTRNDKCTLAEVRAVARLLEILAIRMAHALLTPSTCLPHSPQPGCRRCSFSRWWRMRSSTASSPKLTAANCASRQAPRARSSFWWWKTAASVSAPRRPPAPASACSM